MLLLQHIQYIKAVLPYAVIHTVCRDLPLILFVVAFRVLLVKMVARAPLAHLDPEVSLVTSDSLVPRALA